VNITLDIKCPELAQAINNLAAAMSIRSVDGALQAPEATAEPEKPKTAARSAKAKETTPVTPEPETAGDAGEPATGQTEPASDENESGSAIDYAQVKAAVMKVSTTKGRQAAVDLLGEFNAKVGGDLTEEQWGPFLARAEEVLG
jgi:hypothetical protein